LASLPDSIRCRIRNSSCSLIVPFRPSYLTPASF